MVKKFPFHYGYIVAACCALVTTFNIGLVLSCAGIFFVPVSEELNVAVGQVAMYLSFNLIASAICLSFAGKVLEKFGARLMMTISSAVMGLCLMSMSKFDSLLQFYAAGTILGVTFTFLMYLSFPTLIPKWFKKRVGLFIGIAAAGSSIGGAIFNPVCGKLITLYGWRTTYFILGAVILFFVTPVIGFFLRNKPADVGLKPFGESDTKVSASKKSVAEGIDYSKAIKMPAFYKLFAFGFLMSAVASIFQYLPKYSGTLNFSLEEASFAAAAAMLGSTLGKVGLGILNDRSIYLGISATLGLGIAGLVLIMFGSFGLAILIGGGFLFGWAHAGVFVQTPLLVRKVFGGKSYSQIYSNISMAITAASALAIGGIGFLADFGGYNAVFVCGIISLIICGGLSFTALKK